MWFAIAGGLLGLIGACLRAYDEMAKPRIVRGNMLNDQITRKMHAACKVIAAVEQHLNSKGTNVVAGCNPDDVLAMSETSKFKFNEQHECRVRRFKLSGLALVSCGIIMPLIGIVLQPFLR